jgi:peptidoglycan lytic transglycosylase
VTGDRRNPLDTTQYRNTTHRLSAVTHYLLSAAASTLALGGCGTVTTREQAPEPAPKVSKAPPSSSGTRPGGYYLDDGPGDNPPANLDSIPEPTPRIEPLHRAAGRPYVAMGQSYTPMTSLGLYKAQGLATWYGRRYHGKPTSTGEIYDMYGMTAAHPTLPLPSYARVTHLKTGKSIIVRVNDRGPFFEGRIIDLSYAAAYRLGILGGATLVDVESIIPGSTGTVVATAPSSSPESASRASTMAATSPSDASRSTSKTERTLSVISSAAAESLPAGPPVQLPVTTEAGQIYLQLGAFGSQENAQSYLMRVKSQANWLALQVLGRDGLFRVQAGPYADRSEAQQIADRLSQALGVKALVLTR